MIIDKLIAIILLVGAVYGLIYYVQKQRDKECDYNCEGCKLKQSCKRKDYTQLNKETMDALKES